jgi:N-acetyl-D-muramate 6-phosphate phosphatase
MVGQTPITAIVFDCGETLIDETSQWAAWASWLGTTPFTLMVTLGSVLERNRPFTDVFGLFEPGFDIDAEIEQRRRNGSGHSLTAADLHADVRPSLHQLSRSGLRLFIAGTMTPDERQSLADIGLPVDGILSHQAIGHKNADPAFFEAMAQQTGIPLAELLYVSHRLDTAGAAASEAGSAFAYLRRGPIARIRPDTGRVRARWRVDSLEQLALAVQNRSLPMG